MKRIIIAAPFFFASFGAWALPGLGGTHLITIIKPSTTTVAPSSTTTIPVPTPTRPK